MKIGLASGYRPLVDALGVMALCSKCELALLETVDDIPATGASVLVIEAGQVKKRTWRRYLAYLQAHGEDEETPLAMLTKPRSADVKAYTQALCAKSLFSLFSFDSDNVKGICAFVRKAIQRGYTLHGRAVTCTAVDLLDVEACYLRAHFYEPFIVVVSRPEEKPLSIQVYNHIAERAGIDTLDWTKSAFLAFPFEREDDAREFMAQLPQGMGMLYAGGDVVW